MRIPGGVGFVVGSCLLRYIPMIMEPLCLMWQNNWEEGRTEQILSKLLSDINWVTYIYHPLKISMIFSF